MTPYHKQRIAELQKQGRCYYEYEGFYTISVTAISGDVSQDNDSIEDTCKFVFSTEEKMDEFISELEDLNIIEA